MTTPTFRNLRLDELLDRGWYTNGSVQRGGIWFMTLVLPAPNDTIIHAVTGEGETAEAAQSKATELANVWRERKAAEQSQGHDGG